MSNIVLQLQGIFSQRAFLNLYVDTTIIAERIKSELILESLSHSTLEVTGKLIKCLFKKSQQTYDIGINQITTGYSYRIVSIEPGGVRLDRAEFVYLIL